MCWKCGNNFEFTKVLSRTETCPKCGADVRSCKNCKFYSVGRHYDCAETVDELIVDKEKANFCDYFELSINSANKTQSSKDAFNALFGDDSNNQTQKSTNPKDAFSALFSKDS